MAEHQLKPITPVSPEQPKETANPSPNSAVIQDAEKPFDSVDMLVSHFGVSGWSDMLLNRSLDTEKVAEKIAFVDKFLKGNLEKQGIKVGSKAYQSFLNQVEKTLGLSDMHTFIHRINKVHDFTRVLAKSQERALRLKNILKRAVMESEQR